MLVMLEYRTAYGEEVGRDFDFLTFTVEDKAQAFDYLKGFLVDVHIKSVKVL